MPHNKQQTALSKSDYRSAFTQKMKEGDMQERVRAAREKNEKRRKLLKMAKEKAKKMDKEIEKKKLMVDEGLIET